MRLRTFVLSALAALAPIHAACAADSITIYAAASLTDALNQIDATYREKSGVVVKASFASSSTLAKQIEQGAPAQVFASADTKWMDYLDHKGLIEDASRKDLLGNALAVIAPADSSLGPQSISATFDWLKFLGSDGRLAIGDPDHVPAGIYAKQALTDLGAWPALQPHLARADDVRGALAFVERGEAPLGIVYTTDARISPKVKIVGVFPQTSHSPIVYPFAIVKNAGSPEVRAYFRYLTGPQSASVFRHYGFATH
ncbi:MAG TPA: molybdate ABC transporter substrate-binding protein [Rhizomicrobium sp.]|jgi:molybdate transport system substrate-binding protein